MYQTMIKELEGEGLHVGGGTVVSLPSEKERIIIEDQTLHKDKMSCTC